MTEKDPAEPLVEFRPPDMEESTLAETEYVSKRMFLIGGGIVGLGMALCLLGVVVIALAVNKVQSEQIANNQKAVNRLEAIERPSEARIRQRVVAALKVCAKDPDCRRNFQLAQREARGAEGKAPAGRGQTTSRSPGSSVASSSRGATRRDRTSDPNGPVARTPSSNRKPPSSEPQTSEPGTSSSPSSSSSGSPPPPASSSESPEPPTPTVDVEIGDPVPSVCVDGVIGINCRH